MIVSSRIVEKYFPISGHANAAEKSNDSRDCLFPGQKISSMFCPDEFQQSCTLLHRAIGSSMVVVKPSYVSVFFLVVSFPHPTNIRLEFETNGTSMLFLVAAVFERELQGMLDNGFQFPSSLCHLLHSLLSRVKKQHFMKYPFIRRLLSVGLVH